VGSLANVAGSIVKPVVAPAVHLKEPRVAVVPLTVVVPGEVVLIGI
jgi:hypothetical protein